MRHECATWECKKYRAKLSREIMGCIKVSRGCRVYIHKVDKENKKWTRKNKIDKKFVLARNRIDKRQAVVASKNQIQYFQVFIS